jgi:hypothetical protein
MQETLMGMRLAIAGVLLLIGTFGIAAEPGDAVSPQVEPARLLRKVIPIWPGLADREAVVIVQMDLLATGKVANIRVAEGGFHEKRFVNAAIAAVELISFEPRRIDGKPVDSLGVFQVFRFQLDDAETGITAEFRSELKKVGKLLDSKDFEGANFHAEWMLSKVVRSSYEYAVLQAQLAETYARVGRVSEATAKAYWATTRTTPLPDFLQLQSSVPANKASDYLLPKEVVANMLELRMKLLVNQGLLMEAMQSYYELAGLVDIPPNDPRAILAAEVAGTIQGSTTLIGTVELGSAVAWVQHLSRRSFTLNNVHGSVTGIQIRCSARPQTVREYRPGVEWKIPPSWGVCKAIVQAKPGTTFDFVEFPDTPAAAPSP